MSQQPIDLGPTTHPAGDQPVLELGASRRPRLAQALGGLGEDRRLVPVTAGVAAVAAFASLVSEWQVTTVDGLSLGGGTPSDKVVPADLADLGAFGSGYLAGLFLLVAAIVLTLFGPPGGRRYARVAGLGVGGTLLALLLALVSLLGDQSRIISRLYTLEIDNRQLEVGYGRGLWCALFAVAAAVAALWLSGRPTRPAPPPAPAGDDDPAPEAPFELTVSAARPFTGPAGSEAFQPEAFQSEVEAYRAGERAYRDEAEAHRAEAAAFRPEAEAFRPGSGRDGISG